MSQQELTQEEQDNAAGAVQELLLRAIGLMLNDSEGIVVNDSTKTFIIAKIPDPIFAEQVSLHILPATEKEQSLPEGSIVVLDLTEDRE